MDEIETLRVLTSIGVEVMGLQKIFKFVSLRLNVQANTYLHVCG
jgi:hypothetical protein